MKTAVKYLCILLAVTLFATVMPLAPSAFAEETLQAEAEALNTYQMIDYSAPVLKRAAPLKAALLKGEEELPAAYDARELGIVPPVRNQDPYGTCWAHAFTSAAEINLVKNGFASAEDIDLSELQLIYYGYGNFYDPLGNLGKDTNCTIDVSPLDRGGSHLITALLADRWCGLADEQIMKYPDDIDFAMNSFDVDGKNRYSHFGDVYPEEYGYAFAEAHLKNAYVINYEDTDGIKQAIVDYGCVASSVYSYSGNNYFNTATGAYYQRAKNTPNHAVTIIGWDDDFPVSAFSSKCRPSAPGAWLVRNSWGEEWGDEGYFWLSYEDTSIRNDFFAFEFDPADKYDGNYQYDGTASVSGLRCGGMKRSGEAAIYTAAKDEYVSAVNFAPLGDTNVEYTVSVYVDPVGNDFHDWPADAEQSGKTTYAGIYTVELDEPVFVEAGHDFAVVVTVTGCDDGVYDIYYDKTDSIGSWLETKADNSAMRGFFFYDDTGLIDMESFGAPRLKAFTTDAGLGTPDEFTASLEDHTVTLNWADVDGADGYEIWAGTDNGAYSLLASVEATAYSFEVSEEDGLLLKYKVRATAGDTCGGFSLSRAVRFPVTVRVEGIELPGTVYEEVSIPVMSAEGGSGENNKSELEQYKSFKIECNFTPENASDKLVAYFVDYPELVQIDFDGTVTGLAPGMVTIWVSTRDGNFTQEFTVTITKHQHVWSTGRVTKEATCTQEGCMNFYCAICGGEKTEKLPMKEHVPYVSVPAVNATCTADGNTAEIRCAACRSILTESQTLQAKGHTPEYLLTVEPDCTHTGYELWKCKNCNYTEQRNATDKLSHDYVLFDSKTPTCTERGYEVYACRGCGRIEIGGELAAYGHGDANDDGSCDRCGIDLGTHAHEKCDCICHRGGIVGMIYKLLNVLWRVFGINPVCKCGASHY